MSGTGTVEPRHAADGLRPRLIPGVRRTAAGQERVSLDRWRGRRSHCGYETHGEAGEVGDQSQCRECTWADKPRLPLRRAIG